MLFKEVKEYSKRQRVNITNNDELKTGTKIVILTSKEYDNFKSEVIELKDQLRNLEKENQLLQKQEQNLKQIIQDVTTPIYENHKKELAEKDKEIKQLTDELNTLKKVCSQYNLDMNGLNIIDILILRKHKKLIKNFNGSIWVNVSDQVITDAKAIPNDKKQ